MKALFITIADLKAKSIIDGNTDADKLIHYIEVAQDNVVDFAKVNGFDVDPSA